MNSPTLIVLAATLAALPVTAAPYTITWGAQNAGGALATSDGGELPTECLVRLGFFDLRSDQVRDLAWNPEALEAHFTELARGRIGEFDGQILPVSGAFAQTCSFDSTALPTPLLSQPLCVWACDAPNLGTARQIGIFSSREWHVQAGQFGAITWDLSQVDATEIWVGAPGTQSSPTLGGPVQQLVSLAVLADASDIDGDGAVRLLEEAFGMDEQSADPELLPHTLSVRDPKRTPGFVLRRHAGGTQINAATYDAGGFRYTVEVSDDLVGWHADDRVFHEVATKAVGGGIEVVTLATAGTGPGAHQFFRVRVERL